MSLNDLKKETSELTSTRNEFHALFVETTRLLNTNTLLPPELVDYGFLFRELENLLDDWRKDCKAAKELVEHCIGKQSVSDMDMTTKIKGTLATGSLDIKMSHVLPKRGTLEFDALLNYLKIPNDAVGRGVISLNWLRMNEYLSEQLALGNKPPPGVITSKPVYKVVFTRKRK